MKWQIRSKSEQTSKGAPIWFLIFFWLFYFFFLTRSGGTQLFGITSDMTHFILIIDESSGSFELSPFKIKQISKFKPKTLNLKMFEDVANGLAKEEALSFDPSLLNIVVKTPPKSDLLAFSNSSKEDSKKNSLQSQSTITETLSQ